jgi:hypothetical protein
VKYTLLLSLLPVVSLAACDPPEFPPQLQDQQIVCSLKGEAFVFIDGYEKTVHSVRRTEADPLCAPLVSRIKPESKAQQ